MAEKTLFDIACEMLRETNPYKKEISEMKYTLDNSEISLVGIIENKLSNYRSSVHNYSSQKLHKIFEAISLSMAEYLEDYHTSFSFKQRTKKKYCEWLKAIKTNYGIESAEIPPEFKVKSSDLDTCISMLKELHSRDGVSKDDLHKNLDMHTRAIQKYLRKLSPDLYEGDKADVSNASDYVPFRIGGQPVQVNIKVKKRVGEREKYFYTPNTVHPIVLQENMAQVITLLSSLCRSYYDYERENAISLSIAFDIWSQLSDYAKEKIKKLYTVNDPDFQDFIGILDNDCPDDHASTYKTERDMALTEDLSINDMLLLLVKAPERKATIIMNHRELIAGAHVIDVEDSVFVIEDSNGNKQTLNIDDTIRIDLE